jgi:HEAT repeat protein
LLLALSASAAQGQGEPFVFANKTTAEWIKLMESLEDAKKRQAVVVILESFPAAEQPKIVLALIGRLKNDPSKEVRATAAQVLGKVAPKVAEADAVAAAKALRQKLEDPKEEVEVRLAAVKALAGKMVPYAKNVIEVLGDILDEENAELRAAAAATLKDYGPDALKVTPQLLTALKNDKLDLYTRIYVLQILTKHSKESAKVVPVLLGVLAEKDASDSLKLATVDGLGAFARDAAGATEPLAELFKDDKTPILLRQSAAQALIKIQADSKKVWPAAKEVMKDVNPAMRIQAIRLAGKLCKAEPELVPTLIKLTDDTIEKNEETQIAVVQELGELGPAGGAIVEETLSKLASSASRQTVRDAAVIALKKVQGKDEK